MPAVDESVLANLENVVKEITNRSNRLREWIDLEPRLRNLQTSFGDIYEKVDQISGIPKSNRMALIKRSWNICKITDIEDLKSFALSAQHIKNTLPSSDGAPPAPLVDAWIQELLQLGNQIQNDLNDTAVVSLKSHCTQFQQALYAHIADQRNLLGREVRELCELAIQLRLKVGT